MDCNFYRRQMLAGLAATCCFSSPVLAVAPLDAVPLYPDSSHSYYRVRMTLKVAGNAEVPKNEVTTDQVRKLPVESDSIIDYEEKLTRDANGVAQAASRYYYEAKTDASVHANRNASNLRSEARRATLQMNDTRSVLYANETQFTDDELQLLRVPVNSLAIDRLLPNKSVKIDESWKIDDAVLAELFDMDATQKSSVEAKLVSFDDKAAKMQIEGTMSASVDGVPTEIIMRGKMTFDRSQRAVTWFAIAMREDRGIGKAEPGFEVTAQVRVIRQALPKMHAVNDDATVNIHTQPSGDKLVIDVRSKQGGFAAYCDRQWRVMHANDRVTMMRMIANDKVIAQCDVRSMPALKEGHQLTLEAFQEEIKRTLDKRFGEFLEAETKVTSNKLRLLRVIVSGTVQDIPVQWIYQHFSNDQGQRSAAIFTLADKQLEAFGGGDMQFAEGFRFIEKQAAQASDEKQDVAASKALVQ